MKGDVIIIQPHHEKAARAIADLVSSEVDSTSGCFVVTVAGESGAGKSEIAAALADALEKSAIRCTILQQDDYFIYPPKSNAEMRRSDIAHVGMSEVRLDLLDDNLSEAIAGATKIVKPLIDFDDDSIGEETVYLERIHVVIVEGTYTTALKNVSKRVFIDRTYIDTREARSLRACEDQDDFLEKILTIEHEIISSHEPRADIIVTREYDVIPA
jgi:uridine kinase